MNEKFDIYKRLLISGALTLKYKSLILLVRNYMNGKNKIGIATLEGIEFIRVEEVIRCEGLQRCTNVVVQNRKNMVSSYNLGEFIKLLENYGFYSPHRSHLINLSHVHRYDREGIILMTDQSAIPVSRRKKQEFLDQLKHL